MFALSNGTFLQAFHSSVCTSISRASVFGSVIPTCFPSFCRAHMFLSIEVLPRDVLVFTFPLAVSAPHAFPCAFSFRTRGIIYRPVLSLTRDFIRLPLLLELLIKTLEDVVEVKERFRSFHKVLQIAC